MSRLRKAGLLPEARLEAARLLVAAPLNVYNQRMVAWVYLDSIKKDSLCLEEALPYAEQLMALGVAPSEHILWEQLYWQLARLLFRLAEVPPTSTQDRLHTILTTCPKLPGKAYSVLLKALLKQASGWTHLPAWLDTWGWENLQPDDFLAEQLPDGKTIPALAERAYLATAKAYLSYPAGNLAGVDDFLTRLDAASEVNPQMVYLLYYRVQLRLKTGQIADALTIFLPFARQKQRDFWVWDLMADLHAGQTGLQCACYAKALTCKAKPEFLVKVRQKFAGLLISVDKWAEAKAQIEEILRVRAAQQWRVPPQLSEWIHTTEYAKAAATKANVNYYTQLAEPAEQLLYNQLPTVLGVISALNTQKKTAQFVVSEELSGGFNYQPFGFIPAVGDCLLLTIEQRSAPDGTFFPKVLHARQAPPTDTPLLRTIQGPFKKIGTIGFVGNAFVEAALASQLTEQQHYQVRAVKSFNTKRQTWGWKAFKIEA